MKPLSVGIIGLGAIGSRLAQVLHRDFKKFARVDFLCDFKKTRVLEIQKKWAPRAQAVSWQVLVDRAQVVIESASQEAALPVAERALRKNKQVLILSVGGLLQSRRLLPLLARTKGRLWVPSGALAGMDGLLAGKEGKIKKVTLVTRKPLRGLEGAPYLVKKKIDLTTIKKPMLIFEGNAAQAIRAFPKNVNVAATLSLAGIGPEKTKVKIYASPTYRRNQHEVEIEGDFGRIRTCVENVPSAANPKTSELAALSAAAVLKKMFGRIYLGT